MEDKQNIETLPNAALHLEMQRQAEALIRRYALQSIWPDDDPAVMQNLLKKLMIEMADLFGRQLEDVSLEDLQRAKDRIESLSLGFGVKSLRLGLIKRTIDRYHKAKPIWDLVGNAYTIGQLCLGNFGPAVRKYGIKVSGAPLARASGVYLAGQVMAAAYWDEKGFEKRQQGELEFDPLFDSLNLEQLRELAAVMGLELGEEGPFELRRQIMAQLKLAVHNRVQALWVEQPTYRIILQTVIQELKISDVPIGASLEEMEGEVIRYVFEQTMDQLSKESLKEYEDLIKQHSEDDYLRRGLMATMKASGMLIGHLQGKKLHLAASTALAAFGKSIGLVPAASVYTGLGAAMTRFFGPIGLATSTGVLVFQWTRARPRKALPFVLYMGVVRATLQMNEEQPKTWWQRLRHRCSLSWFLLKRMILPTFLLKRLGNPKLPGGSQEKP